MYELIYENLRAAILVRLSNKLPHDLYYHGVHHTVDVETQAIRIAQSEKITDPEELFLLKVGCLYHDTGFLFNYQQHEVVGCDLARKDLTECGLTQKQIEIVCGLIMATKIPQTPLTVLEKIICDADLDYLGRADFFSISNTLFEELKARNFIVSIYDWNEIQVKFFKQHSYFTATDIDLRTVQKLVHLEMIVAGNLLC